MTHPPLRRRMVLGLAALAMPAAGRAPRAEAGADTPAAFVRHFEAALTARDVDRVLAFYAEDGVVLTPQGGVVAGRTQIRAALAVNLAAGQPPLRLLNASFDGDADRGVLIWVWHVDGDARAAARGRRVRSMLYMRRDAAGWRIFAETAQIYAPPPD
ncbi:DUF4440 domain-containing protein [Roseomonas sp. CECT 9278]|uniref:YybH family protein n=1 Tax=Roseomonas sp. CECT 9278 TaxID=2845823 RepID=UPI001E44578F|nr:nuclear transport factor 2 family protein [Roseomonas sp. CECT 9278]CAH0297775.1 hypothetical protein ROS9278_04440 [Roseomonas sp. CECT 9278]